MQTFYSFMSVYKSRKRIYCGVEPAEVLRRLRRVVRSDGYIDVEFFEIYLCNELLQDYFYQFYIIVNAEPRSLMFEKALFFLFLGFFGRFLLRFLCLFLFFRLFGRYRVSEKQKFERQYKLVFDITYPHFDLCGKKRGYHKYNKSDGARQNYSDNAEDFKKNAHSRRLSLSLFPKGANVSRSVFRCLSVPIRSPLLPSARSAKAAFRAAWRGLRVRRS